MPNPRGVREAKAREVARRLKAGTATIMGEARRLGCHHATLRKALRALLGERAFGAVMSGSRRRRASYVRKVSPTEARRVVAQLRAGALMADEAMRLGCSVQSLVKALRLAMGEARYQRFRRSLPRQQRYLPSTGSSPLARQHAPRTRRVGDEAARHQQRVCAHSRLLGCTDGNGYARVRCADCSYQEWVIARRAGDTPKPPAE